MAETPGKTQENQDFATVIACIQKIVTMPAREHTQVPTRDLKAFARLVTAQGEEIVALTSRVEALETAVSERTSEKAALLLDLARLTEEKERLLATIQAADDHLGFVQTRWQTLSFDPVAVVKHARGLLRAALTHSPEEHSPDVR